MTNLYENFTFALYYMAYIISRTEEGTTTITTGNKLRLHVEAHCDDCNLCCRLKDIKFKLISYLLI